MLQMDASNASNTVSEDDPFPCLLFFDALKAHAQQEVAALVRKWLNSEWVRLKPDALSKAPFNEKSMVIYSPKGMCLTAAKFCSDDVHSCTYVLDAVSHFPPIYAHEVPYQDNRYPHFRRISGFIRIQLTFGTLFF